MRTERSADGSLEVVAEVAVGIETRKVRVPLGRFEGHVDPYGLRNTPVVVLTESGLEAVVRAGVEAAGRTSLVRLDGHGELPFGARLLDGASTAEVLLVVSQGRLAGDALVVVRALGGRPLPVIALDDPAGARAMLRGCDVDLDVASPSVDEPLRRRIHDASQDLGLFTAHHMIEVDPRPGLVAVGIDADDPPSLHELAAAATGVLAGRVAAGNRRWRSTMEG